MWITIGISVTLSAIVSVLITENLAIKYLEIIDGSISDTMNEIGKLVEMVKSILHKQE